MRKYSPTAAHEPPPLKPLLKWAGGKRWLRPRIANIFLAHRNRRLVEPFCGALGITLGLRPLSALLNDVNPHAINFHRQVQAGLTVRLRMSNDRELYLSHREEFNALILAGRANTKKAAGLFYFLNRTGYNGLCRFNRKGLYNVPFGRYNTINYRRDFTDYQDVFRNWDITCGDFESIKLEPTDFIYADPPYDVPFRQYSAGGFSWEDQERLAHWLARHNGPVVASNQATDAILKLYRGLGFDIETLPGPRAISRTGDRTPAKEMLAVKGL